jgi:hypothetical protein
MRKITVSPPGLGGMPGVPGGRALIGTVRSASPDQKNGIDRPRSIMDSFPASSRSMTRNVERVRPGYRVWLQCRFQIPGHHPRIAARW